MLTASHITGKTTAGFSPDACEMNDLDHNLISFDRKSSYQKATTEDRSITAMPYIHPISTVSSTIQDPESLLIMAPGGTPFSALNRPSNGRTGTRKSTTRDSSRNDNKASVFMWDILMNSCTGCGTPQGQGRSAAGCNYDNGKIYRSNPMSPMSPAGSFMDDYYDMLIREKANGTLYKGTELQSADSSLSSRF